MLFLSLNLRELYLHWNFISAVGFGNIFRQLIDNPRLVVLDVSSNNIGTGFKQEQSDTLSRFLITNKRLAHLDLSANSIPSDFFEDFQSALTQNKSIKGLHINGNFGGVSLDHLGYVHKQKASFFQKVQVTQNRHRISGVRPYSFSDPINVSKVSHNCWICEGWNLHSFSFDLKNQKIDSMGNSQKVFLKIKLSNLTETEMINREDNDNIFELKIMLPPIRIKYYFEVRIFDSKDIDSFKSYQFYDQDTMVKKSKMDVECTKLIEIPSILDGEDESGPDDGIPNIDINIGTPQKEELEASQVSKVQYREVQSMKLIECSLIRVSHNNTLFLPDYKFSENILPRDPPSPFKITEYRYYDNRPLPPRTDGFMYEDLLSRTNQSFYDELHFDYKLQFSVFGEEHDIYSLTYFFEYLKSAIEPLYVLFRSLVYLKPSFEVFYQLKVRTSSFLEFIAQFKFLDLYGEDSSKQDNFNSIIAEYKKQLRSKSLDLEFLNFSQYLDLLVLICLSWYKSNYDETELTPAFKEVLQNHELNGHRKQLESRWVWKSKVFQLKEVKFLVNLFYHPLLEVYKIIGSMKIDLPQHTGFNDAHSLSFHEYLDFLESLHIDGNLINKEKIADSYFSSLDDRLKGTGLGNMPLMLIDEFIEAICKLSDYLYRPDPTVSFKIDHQRVKDRSYYFSKVKEKRNRPLYRKIEEVMVMISNHFRLCEKYGISSTKSAFRYHDNN